MCERIQEKVMHRRARAGGERAGEGESGGCDSLILFCQSEPGKLFVKQ